MLRFLKEHLFLLIGATLPIILVLFLWMMATMPQWTTEPPQYDLIYMTYPYSHTEASIEVIDGKLRILATPNVIRGGAPMPRLFLFNAKTQAVRELPISLSPMKLKGINMNNNQKQEIIVPELNDIHLETTEVAPDGYKVEFASHAKSGLVWLLYAGSTQSNLIISKDLNTLNIMSKVIDRRYANDNGIKFLGWVIPQKDKDPS